MERVDAVVIGAGPAGSAAAVALARAGRGVVLCDRSAFPRDKPCGDLIGVHALAMARQLGVSETALNPYPLLTGALVSGGGRTIHLTADTPAGSWLLRRFDARVIPRTVFDHGLACAATRAGAELRQLTVRNVGPWDTKLRGRVVAGVSPDGPEELLAHGVIIAGGYGCRVAADIIPNPEPGVAEPPRGIAMRGYVERVSGLEHRIAFFLDDWLLPGYGWIFPLPGGRANVGVGTLVQPGTSASEPLRDLYERFITDPMSPASIFLRNAKPTVSPRSWPLDLGPRRRRLAAHGLLVAGEAAGLVGPLTGAGIAFALASGGKAGDALAKSISMDVDSERPLHDYARTINRQMLPWLRAEALAQRWLSDPVHIRRLLSVADRFPGAGPVGASLLLRLG